MLDRTIPYCNMILKCRRFTDNGAELPDGYVFRGYRPGDERAWAKLEYAIGDFDAVEEAEAYFTETYFPHLPELKKRAVFVTDAAGTVVGSCIAWRDARGDSDVASLHWLVVSPEREGQGIGKALCRRVMQIYAELGEFPVYLHTQPWSYRAVFLYFGLGFRLQKNDTFKEYENQYSRAMEILKNVLDRDHYRKLEEYTEDGL